MATDSIASHSSSQSLKILRENDLIFDEYYVAYTPIILPCISFMFIKMKFIQCHPCVLFVMKSTSICND